MISVGKDLTLKMNGKLTSLKFFLLSTEKFYLFRLIVNSLVNIVQSFHLIAVMYFSKPVSDKKGYVNEVVHFANNARKTLAALVSTIRPDINPSATSEMKPSHSSLLRNEDLMMTQFCKSKSGIIGGFIGSKTYMNRPPYPRQIIDYIDFNSSPIVSDEIRMQQGIMESVKNMSLEGKIHHPIVDEDLDKIYSDPEKNAICDIIVEENIENISENNLNMENVVSNCHNSNQAKTVRSISESSCDSNIIFEGSFCDSENENFCDDYSDSEIDDYDTDCERKKHFNRNPLIDYILGITDDESSDSDEESTCDSQYLPSEKSIDYDFFDDDSLNSVIIAYQDQPKDSTLNYDSSCVDSKKNIVEELGSSLCAENECNESVLNSLLELEDLHQMILEANNKWNSISWDKESHKKESEHCDKNKKVKFLTKDNEIASEIFYVPKNEDRKGSWELMALDRYRFQRRIDELEKILNPILDSKHRDKVYYART